jgi:thiamine-phosphate pyrophosphorylase
VTGGAEASFPRLIAITDLELCWPEPTVARLERLCAAARAGAVMVQLRGPTLTGRALLQVGAEISRLCRAHGQLFSVNDRLDVARLFGADAVHLGEASIETADARRFFGAVVPPGSAAVPPEHATEPWVTRACHDPDLVAAVDGDGVLLSPILAARKGRGALGLEGLERARRVLAASGSTTRLYALGGVDAQGARRCLEAGADGVAAIGAVFGGADAQGLLEALGGLGGGS